MNTTNIISTNKWYEESAYQSVHSLAEQYDNAIPIFGGALGAYEHINCDSPNYKQFIKCLVNTIEDAKFYKWHEGAVGAARRFCRLCLVDPALIELYIGTSFEELCKGV